jgi:sugar lactone lactonase YvrE
VLRRTTVALLTLVVVSAAACSGSDDNDGAEGTTTTTAASGPVGPFVLNGQGNDLAAYLADEPFTKQIVIPHRSDEQPEGLDINGQICFDPENPRRFVAGEDTLQTTTGEPGWGIFDLEGDEIGDLSATQVGKLVPTYQSSEDNAENYGCGFLSDGRIVTTDIGNQAEGTGDGQLIVWFGPFDSRDVKYCKIDVTLTTGQGVLVDGDSVYVAQARPPKSGIYRYDASTFPTSDTPEGGCDGTDATGAPMTTKVTPTVFITAGQGNSLATPNAIAMSEDGKLYVTSVFNGVIAEFTRDGTYVRDILKPPAGEVLGAQPFSTGTPLGIGVGPDGSVYYADIGITATPDGIGPGDGTGHVRRITFDAQGEPQPPESMDEGLAFPDGIGILAIEG